MPAFNKVVLRGTIADSEQWSCSINFGAPGGGSVISGQQDLQDAAQAIQNLFATSSDPSILGLRAMLSTVVTIDRTSIYYYPATTGPAGGVGESIGNEIEGTGTVENVAQVACVASLRTVFPGRRFRGRFYWPAIGAGIGSSLQMSDPSAASAAGFFAGALGEMQVTLTPFGAVVPVVVSVAGDEVTAVTAVSVDSILDTQRRRSQGLVGTTSTVAI